MERGSLVAGAAGEDDELEAAAPAVAARSGIVEQRMRSTALARLPHTFSVFLLRLDEISG